MDAVDEHTRMATVTNPVALNSAERPGCRRSMISNLRRQDLVIWQPYSASESVGSATLLREGAHQPGLSRRGRPPSVRLGWACRRLRSARRFLVRYGRA